MFLACVSWRVSAQKLVRRQYEFLEYEFIYAANSNIIWVQFQTSIEQSITSEHQQDRGMSDNIPMLKSLQYLIICKAGLAVCEEIEASTEELRREILREFTEGVDKTT